MSSHTSTAGSWQRSPGGRSVRSRGTPWRPTTTPTTGGTTACWTIWSAPHLGCARSAISSLAALQRFDGYADRFTAALERVLHGNRAWVDQTGIDSCHTVWIELHEDLLSTLGLERGDGSRAG